jgi:anti-sigma regulatory factor (Ser/Thr protein kinase)
VTLGTRNGTAPHDHVVQFYEHDDDLVGAVCAYLIDAIRADEVAVAVVTPEHAIALQDGLLMAGIDPTAEQDRGNLVIMDAVETLARFMVHGWPEEVAFDGVIGSLMSAAGARGQRVRVFGEMVAVLWDEGRVNAAIELEGLWNELGRQMSFSLYCAYGCHPVDGEPRPEFDVVCKLHSAVIGEPIEVARSFAGAPASSAAARRFVNATLETWGLQRYRADALLVTAELASNAVVHARTDFTVGIASRNGAVRISVRDQSKALPRSREAPPRAPSGRGLVLIATICDRWGTELLGDGKLVWADLRA